MLLTSNEVEEFVIKAEEKEILLFLMEYRLLKRENRCDICFINTVFTKYHRSRDGYAWRCYNSSCRGYKKYFSIRRGSFFEDFRVPLKDIMRVIIKYSQLQQTHIISNNSGVSKCTVERILKKLYIVIPKTDFSQEKLGRPGFIVQIDETMLNFRCKSHRGRSPSNRTDALCIVEVNRKISRVFATIIENKKAETIIPIICSQVVPGSVIWTDEHKTYSCLSKNGFIHDSVCHKYEFINRERGVNTQAVESFHNELKLRIKQQKGVKTEKRSEFLKEFCFYFNNRSNFFGAVINLLKV